MTKSQVSHRCNQTLTSPGWLTLRPEGGGSALRSGFENWAEPSHAPCSQGRHPAFPAASSLLSRRWHFVLIQVTSVCESGNPKQKLPRCDWASRAATLASLALVSGSTAGEGQRGQEGAHRASLANKGRARLTI